MNISLKYLIGRQEFNKIIVNVWKWLYRRKESCKFKEIKVAGSRNWSQIREVRVSELLKFLCHSLSEDKLSRLKAHFSVEFILYKDYIT